MFAKLKLSINAGKTPKLRNPSGKDMMTHGVMTVKFKMGNTIFVQDFIACEDLVRPIFIGRDFTVSNFIGVIWMRQGMKKVMKDDRVVIEVEEPVRGKALSTTRRVVIPPRQYVILELECDELQGRFEIKPEPFLQQKEPNLWMDNFVIYNIPEDKEVDMNEEAKIQKAPIRNEDSMTINNESGKEQKMVCIPYCIFNLSYVNHSYIPRGRVIAFAEKEKEENEIFKVEDIKGQEEYRNWVLKNRGSLPVPPTSDFLCSPAEVSKHRKVKLKSKPIEEDTAQKFDELCNHFSEIFSKSSEDIGKTNLTTMDINTGDHPPICQKPYTLDLKHYEWVQKEVEQLERAGIIAIVLGESYCNSQRNRHQTNPQGEECVLIFED